jgi:hypothetical protein
MKTLTVKISDGVYANIAGDAKARNVPKSEIVRERLMQNPASRTKGSLWDRMQDLVIREDSLPADLSSNRKHLGNYGKNRAH